MSESKDISNTTSTSHGHQDLSTSSQVATRENAKSYYLSIALDKFRNSANSAVKILELYRCNCGAAIEEGTKKKFRNLLLYTIVEESEETEEEQSILRLQYLRSIESNLRQTYSKVNEQQQIIQRLRTFICQQFRQTQPSVPLVSTQNPRSEFVETLEIPVPLLEITGTSEQPSVRNHRKECTGTQMRQHAIFEGVNDDGEPKQLGGAQNEVIESVSDDILNHQFDELGHRHNQLTNQWTVNDHSNQQQNVDRCIAIGNQEGTQVRNETSDVRRGPRERNRVTDSSQRLGDRHFRDIPDQWQVKLYAMLNYTDPTDNNWHSLAWKLAVQPYLIQNWSNSAAFPNPTKLVLDTWKVRREATIGVLRRTLRELGRDECVQEVDTLAKRMVDKSTSLVGKK